MNTFTLFVLALGLSMDAFAVSVSNGMCFRHIGAKHVFYTAFTFGLFQMGMPVIGYFAGQMFSDAVSFLDHWIALLFLGIIGGKMIADGIKDQRKEKSENMDCQIDKKFSWKLLILQAVATSIDALAVGISFAMIKVDILMASSFIGMVTFFFCVIGSVLGRKFGALLKDKAEIFGGVILMGIGLKLFIEHIFQL